MSLLVDASLREEGLSAGVPVTALARLAHLPAFLAGVSRTAGRNAGERHGRSEKQGQQHTTKHGSPPGFGGGGG